jgi:hypothetical protein
VGRRPAGAQPTAFNAPFRAQRDARRDRRKRGEHLNHVADQVNVDLTIIEHHQTTTPTTRGTFPVTATATDSVGASASTTFTWTIKRH